MKLKGANVAIQGYGNAGSHLATLLHEEGARIVAVSDSKGGVLRSRRASTRPRSHAHKDDGREPQAPSRRGKPITNKQLLELPVDILVPAALENQITVDQRRAHPGQDHRRGRQRSDHAAGRRDPVQARPHRDPRHPRQRRRRDRVATSSGCRTSRRSSGTRTRSTSGSRCYMIARLPRGGGDGRASTSAACATAPTCWRWTGWPRRHACGGSSRRHFKRSTRPGASSRSERVREWSCQLAPERVEPHASACVWTPRGRR